MTDCLYTTKLGDEICRRVSEGESVRALCRDPDIPVTEGAVRAWARQNLDGFGVRFCDFAPRAAVSWKAGATR